MDSRCKRGPHRSALCRCSRGRQERRGRRRPQGAAAGRRRVKGAGRGPAQRSGHSQTLGGRLPAVRLGLAGAVLGLALALGRGDGGSQLVGAPAWQEGGGQAAGLSAAAAAARQQPTSRQGGSPVSEPRRPAGCTALPDWLKYEPLLNPADSHARNPERTCSACRRHCRGWPCGGVRGATGGSPCSSGVGGGRGGQQWWVLCRRADARGGWLARGGGERLAGWEAPRAAGKEGSLALEQLRRPRHARAGWRGNGSVGGAGLGHARPPRASRG